MNEIKEVVDPTLARALWLGGTDVAPRRAKRQSGAHREASPRPPIELHPRESGRPLIFMSYAVGDYVVPTDLPRQFLCRVTHAHGVGNTPLQVLELAPLEGPWPYETRLVRGGDSVRPAAASELADLRRLRAGRRMRPGGLRRGQRGRRRMEVSDAG
jgi:hypothetical protein